MAMFMSKPSGDNKLFYSYPEGPNVETHILTLHSLRIANVFPVDAFRMQIALARASARARGQ
eukprot:2589588-Pyramimonas_sp.AAC.1